MSWRSHSVEYLSDNLFFETLLSSTTSHSASIYILRPKSRLSQSYDTRHDILQLSSAHSSSLQLSSALFSSLQLTMVWSFRPQRGTIQRYCNILKRNLRTSCRQSRQLYGSTTYLRGWAFHSLSRYESKVTRQMRSLTQTNHILARRLDIWISSISG